MDVRAVVRGIGRSMITAGVLVLLFVAYQLWGTGLREREAQADLRSELEQSVPGDAPVVGEPVPPDASAPTDPGAPPAGPPPTPEGKAVAIIRIPKIGVDKAVVEGVGVGDLKKGPGHYPETPLPGEPGNAAIAGHRTTYGAPFGDLDELEPGDQILVTTKAGRFDYEVREKRVVKPTEVSVLNPTDDNRLTLTTCHPRYSAAQRLIVVAALKGEATEPAPRPDQPPSGNPDDQEPASRADPAGNAEPASLDSGLSGDPAARGPAVLWGSVFAGVFLLVALLGRLWRRWPVYLLGAAPLAVTLFMFFENFARLLPANV